MPVDIRRLMHRAAGEPDRAPDTAAILRRASHLRRRSVVIAGAALLLIVGSLTAGLVVRSNSQSTPKIAGEPHTGAPVGTITLFPRPTPSIGGFTNIAPGPDRTLWAIPAGGEPRLERISLHGTIREIPIPNRAVGIAGGKDGKVYFGQPGGLGRISADTSGFEFFPLPDPQATPMGVTAAPDGDIWVTRLYASQVWRFSPRSATFQAVQIPEAVQGPAAIASDSKGNMWIEAGTGHIVRVDRNGEVDLFPVPGQGVGFGITAAPNGDVWFTGYDAAITRVTPAGQTTQYQVPNASAPSLVGITAGADGNLWFANFEAKTIGRISPQGEITQYPIEPADQIPGGVAPGADGNVWFTTPTSIGRITTGAAPDGK
jgi:virginiamycin B lyase